MSAEVPRQMDMFTGKLVDIRSSYQRRLDGERQRPQQSLMFPIAEVFQFGVSAKPWLKTFPAGTLVLEREDIRTPEEIEREIQREAETLTAKMFAPPPQVPQAVEIIDVEPDENVDTTIMSKSMGYRAYARQQLVQVRRLC